MIKFLIVLFSGLLITCSPKSANMSDDKASMGIAIEQNCYEDRKVDGSVENLKVTILEKADKFFCVRENTHYEPCEIPAEFAKAGKEVIISGDIMEIYPNERRMGTPFHLKSIREQ